MEIEIKDSGRKMPLLNLDRIFDYVNNMCMTVYAFDELNSEFISEKYFMFWYDINLIIR